MTALKINKERKVVYYKLERCELKKKYLIDIQIQYITL